MRETSFGKMCSLDFGKLLASDCEVMHFHQHGRSHTHDRVEIAVCVVGSGAVVVNGTYHEVSDGDYVRIPAGARHHMETYSTMCMLILYIKETK